MLEWRENIITDYNKIKKILNHKLFIENMRKIIQIEENRIYCKHDIFHCFDVARICYIIVLENNLHYDKDVIYALALLHDIGRAKQYESGEDHSLIGGEIAAQIMHDVAFSEHDIELVKDIILKHSGEHNILSPKTLKEAFLKSDFLARKCSFCSAIDTCKWKTKNFRNDI